MKFGRAVVDGRPRLLVAIDGGLRDFNALPGRSMSTDGIDLVADPVTAEELASLASAPVSGLEYHDVTCIAGERCIILRVSESLPFDTATSRLTSGRLRARIPLR